MDKTEQFYRTVNDEQTAILATAAGASVTMRLISPVLFENKVLFFTSPTSTKYRQLESSPHCCLSIGAFFAEADAELLGSTMLEENTALRTAYAAKFPDAFDENVDFGGVQADFVLLTPKRLSGWAFPDDIISSDGIPTIPFEILL